MVILVFGATGAQGRHVVDSLLAHCQDGSPSPYTVRALTRDPEGKRALALCEKGIELVKGRSSFVHHPGFNLLRMAAAEDVCVYYHQVTQAI